jgi:hypothetical protein
MRGYLQRARDFDEGTEHIQGRIVGRDITGAGAIT